MRPRAETRGELTAPTRVRTCEPSVNQSGVWGLFENIAWKLSDKAHCSTNRPFFRRLLRTPQASVSPGAQPSACHNHFVFFGLWSPHFGGLCISEFLLFLVISAAPPLNPMRMPSWTRACSQDGPQGRKCHRHLHIYTSSDSTAALHDYVASR